MITQISCRNRPGFWKTKALIIVVAALCLPGFEGAMSKGTRNVKQVAADLREEKNVTPKSKEMNQVISTGNVLTDNNELAAISLATGWLNSKPLSGMDLKGKVVLINFWTYTCINWLRTLPYVRAWHEKYSKHGLVVIGVHSPEFSFEKDSNNVRRAVKDMRVNYPVAVDSDHTIWRAAIRRG